MIKIIQPIYKFIFNGTYKLTRNIPLKVRYSVVNVCLFILTGLFFYQCGVESLGFNPGTVQTRTVIGVIAIILICIFSVNKKLEYVKQSPWIIYPFDVVGKKLQLDGLNEFLSQCNYIDCVVVLGHSMSSLEVEYMEQIEKKICSLKWYISQMFAALNQKNIRLMIKLFFLNQIVYYIEKFSHDYKNL